MLNCKAGDLAIFVKSTCGNEGKIVRCVKYLGVLDFDIVGLQKAWRIDQMVASSLGVVTDIACDSFLRPIHDTDGQDEMIRIAGLPNEETVNG